MPHPMSGITPQTQIDGAARVKTEKRLPAQEDKLISYMSLHHHDTPFEMVEFMFRLRAPMMVVRQIERHRTFSYNEESARYGEMKDQWYIPKSFRVQDKLNKQSSAGVMDRNEDWRDMIVNTQSMCYALYVQAIAEGMAKEQARLFLPASGLYVNLMMKGNLRNFVHFLTLRLHSDTQWETQWYASAITRAIDSLVGHSYIEDTLDNECMYNLENMAKFDYQGEQGVLPDVS